MVSISVARKLRVLDSQAPVLFPICGSLRDDEAIYRPCTHHILRIIPRHGLVRKKNFTYEQISIIALHFQFEQLMRLWLIILRF